METLFTSLEVLKSIKLVKYNKQLILKILSILKMVDEFPEC